MTIESKSGQTYRVNASIVDLTTVTVEKIEWNWKPYFPVGKLVIIDGDGGSGKTSLLLDIMARMSTGTAMPDKSRTEVAGSVYITYEDGIADTIKPRLQKVGADFSKIRVIKDVAIVNDSGEDEVRPFSLSEDLNLLQRAIEEVGARLVVIDPITSAIDGKVDSYKDQEVRKALNPLITFAEDNGVTVVMVRHFTKQKTENINHKGVGSLAYINISRVGLAVVPDSENEGGMLLVHSKHNLTKEAKPLKYKLVSDKDEVVYVDWQGASNLTIKQIMSTTKPSEVRQEIMNYLSVSKEGMSTGEMQMALSEQGYGEGNVRMTLSRMRDEGVIEQVARGKYRMPQPVA